MFRERSGAAALSGRDLPADQTLAAFAHVNARAGVYKESGVFPEEGMDRLRATAYLDILNDISAEDRIAYGRLNPDDAPTDDARPDAPTTPAPTHPTTTPDDDAPDDDAPDAGAGLGGSDCPCDECDGRCAPPDDSHFPDDDEPDDGEPGAGEPGAGEPEAGEPDGDGPSGSGSGGPRGGGGSPATGGPADEAGPGAGGDRGSAPPAPRSPFLRPPAGPPPTLTDLVFPLATLLGLAERPGEGHGLGTLDPALCRALAATAARSPHTTICITVTDADGIAIGHGCVKLRPPRRPARRAAPRR